LETESCAASGHSGAGSAAVWFLASAAATGLALPQPCCILQRPWVMVAASARGRLGLLLLSARAIYCWTVASARRASSCCQPPLAASSASSAAFGPLAGQSSHCSRPVLKPEDPWPCDLPPQASSRVQQRQGLPAQEPCLLQSARRRAMCAANWKKLPCEVVFDCVTCGLVSYAIHLGKPCATGDPLSYTAVNDASDPSGQYSAPADALSTTPRVVHAMGTA